MSDSQAKTVRIDPDAVIDSLTVENIRHRFASGREEPVLVNEGRVAKFTEL